MKNLMKQAGLEVKFDSAIDSVRETSKRLEHVTVRADMMCDEIHVQIAKLEQRIEVLQAELEGVRKLRETAYVKMIAINGLLGE